MTNHKHPEPLDQSQIHQKIDFKRSLISIMKPIPFRSGDPDVGTVMKLGEKSAPSPIPHGFSSQLSIVYQSLEFGNLPVGLRISGTGQIYLKFY
jgi:hypothetical protein